ncbi:hypothetical protein OC834_000615 [Tilletia horrida]|uniref:Uncharacterized protein n=1 Tax=Tilletia horrida TaxID=155126 RepID=A0AAN6JTU2_9BASI|nr:hypothetical protein OC834_000615 [Tilletia horrida]KAK0539884.1 hypothetical protein OC842_000768 [Tilletia horrida]KAK0560732.1 hypothetical protein OC844_003582 [Tilletia horrida]
MAMEPSINVFGKPLEPVGGTGPTTGFFRNGRCDTGPSDGGAHTVAAVVNDGWLKFSAARGNDLRPILSSGCSWCLCVSRWKEALDAYKAGHIPRDAVPAVKLEATHQAALRVVDIKDLEAFRLKTDSSTAKQSNGRQSEEL